LRALAIIVNVAVDADPTANVVVNGGPETAGSA
jgi:hypothetical protein